MLALLNDGSKRIRPNHVSHDAYPICDDPGALFLSVLHASGVIRFTHELRIGGVQQICS